MNLVEVFGFEFRVGQRAQACSRVRSTIRAGEAFQFGPRQSVAN